MPRVKRGTIANKTRRNTLKHTKGFRWGGKSKERLARERLLHAWTHAFRGRKEKKRLFRRLWSVKINASVRQEGMSYSTLIHKLKENNIEIDRKILSQLAEHHPETFKKIVENVK